MYRFVKNTTIVGVAAALAFGAPIAQACNLGPEEHGQGIVKPVEPGPEHTSGEAEIVMHSGQFTEVTEIAAVELEEIDGVSVTTADVYAHKDHAYLGTHRGARSNEGVRVFDMNDPHNPEEVAVFANDIPGTWQEKVIVKSVDTPHFTGDLAVVSLQKYNQDETEQSGTAIYDVTNPERPVQLGYYELPVDVLTGTHELYLTTQEDRAILLLANIYADYYTEGDYHDFTVVDVSDPANPEHLYNWDPRELVEAEDFDGMNYTDEDGAERTAFAHSVITDKKGEYAYISYWDLGTIIMDIRNPDQPEVVGHTTFERDVQGAAHSAALAHDDTILIETREVFEPDPDDPEFERGWGYTRIYDISDKSNPELISDIRSDNSMEQIKEGERERGTYTVHDPKVEGDKLYLSHYSDGIRLVDISNPHKPREVASYVPSAANVWGVFIYGDYILGSDMGSGLKVLDVNWGTAPGGPPTYTTPRDRMTTSLTGIQPMIFSALTFSR
ncbi:LVIVD repeat-containing protein [Geomicrobium sp. JCM 19038]|uniref:LVIVD repeat-containing protein n=1 Tax=Geomicrobium sp. JCM 19038 TaxID=1460635 RepID=UPI00045F36A8|nr:hypothetical protein [Geomicrobium sp. JCM 19038]GAK10100.1 hypothetical protein JCM19038_3982 [Geomicrobium sp. JCM 19038]